eukprot:Rmarinus@m.26677
MSGYSNIPLKPLSPMSGNHPGSRFSSPFPSLSGSRTGLSRSPTRAAFTPSVDSMRESLQDDGANISSNFPAQWVGRFGVRARGLLYLQGLKDLTLTLPLAQHCTDDFKIVNGEVVGTKKEARYCKTIFPLYQFWDGSFGHVYPGQLAAVIWRELKDLDERMGKAYEEYTDIHAALRQFVEGANEIQEAFRDQSLVEQQAAELKRNLGEAQRFYDSLSSRSKSLDAVALSTAALAGHSHTEDADDTRTAGSEDEDSESSQLRTLAAAFADEDYPDANLERVTFAIDPSCLAGCGAEVLSVLVRSLISTLPLSLKFNCVIMASPDSFPAAAGRPSGVTPNVLWPAGKRITDEVREEACQWVEASLQHLGKMESTSKDWVSAFETFMDESEEPQEGDPYGVQGALVIGASFPLSVRVPLMKKLELLYNRRFRVDTIYWCVPPGDSAHGAVNSNAHAASSVGVEEFLKYAAVTTRGVAMTPDMKNVLKKARTKLGFPSTGEEDGSDEPDNTEALQAEREASALSAQQEAVAMQTRLQEAERDLEEIKGEYEEIEGRVSQARGWTADISSKVADAERRLTAGGVPPRFAVANAHAIAGHIREERRKLKREWFSVRMLAVQCKQEGETFVLRELELKKLVTPVKRADVISGSAPIGEGLAGSGLSPLQRVSLELKHGSCPHEVSLPNQSIERAHLREFYRSLGLVDPVKRLLETVNFTGCKLGDVSIRELCPHVLSFRAIKRFDLSKNLLGDAAAVAVADWVRQDRVLEVLMLNDNHITGRGCVALAEALRENNTLRELDLRSNTIGASGLRKLARVISEENSVLTRASIAQNPCDIMSALSPLGDGVRALIYPKALACPAHKYHPRIFII